MYVFSHCYQHHTKFLSPANPGLNAQMSSCVSLYNYSMINGITEKVGGSDTHVK